MARERTVGSLMPPVIAQEPSRVAPDAAMIEAILGERMPVEEFERAYRRRSLDDRTHWQEPILRTLNEVFLDVEAFYPDPTIRGYSNIDEVEFRRWVERSLADSRRVL